MSKAASLELTIETFTSSKPNRSPSGTAASPPAALRAFAEFLAAQINVFVHVARHVIAPCGALVHFGEGDFCLRRAIEALRGYGESNLFLRGIIPRLGFPHASVSYDRSERFAGESKYPLRRMIGFAVQGITSFSAAPLRAITLFGLLVSFVSFGAGAWVIWARLFSDEVVPGWASTLVPIFFLGGIQLLSLGVIGEYVSKIYLETKQRPRYIIERDI